MFRRCRSRCLSAICWRLLKLGLWLGSVSFLQWGACEIQFVSGSVDDVYDVHVDEGEQNNSGRLDADWISLLVLSLLTFAMCFDVLVASSTHTGLGILTRTIRNAKNH